MTFDTNISSEVSLSKVLDAFIIENEKSSIIVQFLKQYDNAFKDILKYSLYGNKLFQLDFFLTCNSAEQSFIISKLKDIDKNVAATLIWQILNSTTEKTKYFKHIFSKDLRQYIDNDVRHPYSNGHKKYIAELDAVCSKFIEDNNISDIPYLVDNSKLRDYFKYIPYNSLFIYRLLQYDFFSGLDDLSKYVFINATFDNCPVKYIHSIIIFAMQVLDSNESVEVKKLVYDKLCSNVFEYNIIDRETLNIIQKCKSFSELMLKMTIFNSDVSIFVVLYLLLFKLKWIKEWVEYNSDELNSYLNISELVKTINVVKKKHR